QVEMVSLGNNMWSGNIPAQPVGTRIYYYVEGESNSGKILQRPIAAPSAYWHFDIIGANAIQDEAFSFTRIFPNPATAITCVEFESHATQFVTAFVVNSNGQRLDEIYKATLSPGSNKFFLHANKYAAGMYFVELVSEKGVYHLPFVVQ
ncbi:MAG: T9SS type A sorting domain-containing protein, partial [Bacteroidota bacterium]